MKIAKHFALTSMLAAVVGILACSSTAEDPCSGKGTAKGTDLCASMQTPIEAKCGASSFNCETLLAGSGCKTTDTYCKPGVEKAIADLNAAADCDAVKKVTFAYVCYR